MNHTVLRERATSVGRIDELGLRLAVLDVGSNSVKLQIIDAYAGAPPLPIFSFRVPLRLAEHLDEDDAIPASGAKALVAAIANAAELAMTHGANEVIAVATEVLRRASNGDVVRAEIEREAGVTVPAIAGEDEARLTFLAARRWLGWSAGRILLLDIGGGSFEIAYGRDEEPSLALSLPLGAGALTSEFLTTDPPRPKELRALRAHVKDALGDVARRLRWEGVPSCVVATSKTFKQLARLGGAPGSRRGPFAERSVDRETVEASAKSLARMGRARRARQRGISRSRADQMVAGAVVADVAMHALDVRRVSICPWGVREGLLLRRVDRLHDASAAHDHALIAHATT